MVPLLTNPGVSCDDPAEEVDEEDVPLASSTTAALLNSVFVGVGLAKAAEAERSWSTSGRNAALFKVIVRRACTKAVVIGPVASGMEEARVVAGFV